MSLVCTEVGCPLATDGRCLEGYEDATECPHTQETPDADTAPAAASEPLVDEAVGDEAHEELEQVRQEPATIDLSGDQSLSIAEAEPVAARYGSRVVLIGGAFASGKTSLVAGLYGLFHDGPVGDHSFAGSTSLVALDARYHGKRASSGLSEPQGARTRDEDMRLLDLRVRKAGQTLNLMFSDVRGEYFEAVVGGQPVGEVVSLASRADLAIVLLDGARVTDRFERAKELHFARQLIGGLTEQGGLRPGLPLALVVSKVDELPPESTEWLSEQIGTLSSFALERGFASVDRLDTAAFAKADAVEHQGMAELLAWIVDDRWTPAPMPVIQEPSDMRSFLRGPARG